MLVTVGLWTGAAPPVFAQDEGRMYAGALVGVSTLSADAQASTQPGRAEVSLYKPENGPALNLFVGAHVGRYFTVQANYVWNRNDLTLFSSLASSDGGAFYEQARASSQHAVVGDALLYFRALGSGIRPYLSTGGGLVRFESEQARPWRPARQGLKARSSRRASRCVSRSASISRWVTDGAFGTASARRSAAIRSARA